MNNTTHHPTKTTTSPPSRPQPKRTMRPKPPSRFQKTTTALGDLRASPGRDSTVLRFQKPTAGGKSDLSQVHRRTSSRGTQQSTQQSTQQKTKEKKSKIDRQERNQRRYVYSPSAAQYSSKFFLHHAAWSSSTSSPGAPGGDGGWPARTKASRTRLERC